MPSTPTPLPELHHAETTVGGAYPCHTETWRDRDGYELSITTAKHVHEFEDDTGVSVEVYSPPYSPEIVADCDGQGYVRLTCPREQVDAALSWIRAVLERNHFTVETA